MNGMTESRFLLDTNAIIFLTAKGSIIPASVQAELNKADPKPVSLPFSIVQPLSGVNLLNLLTDCR